MWLMLVMRKKLGTVVDLEIDLQQGRCRCDNLPRPWKILGLFSGGKGDHYSLEKHR